MQSGSLRRKALAGITLALAMLVLASSVPARVPVEWSTPLEAGETAPDFALVDSSGAEIRLSQFGNGRYVVLDFYLGWF